MFHPRPAEAARKRWWRTAEIPVSPRLHLLFHLACAQSGSLNSETKRVARHHAVQASAVECRTMWRYLGTLSFTCLRMSQMHLEALRSKQPQLVFLLGSAKLVVSTLGGADPGKGKGGTVMFVRRVARQNHVTLRGHVFVLKLFRVQRSIWLKTNCYQPGTSRQL